MERVTDANECFLQIVDEIAEQVNANDKQVEWVLGKSSRVLGTGSGFKRGSQRN